MGLEFTACFGSAYRRTELLVVDELMRKFVKVSISSHLVAILRRSKVAVSHDQIWKYEKGNSATTATGDDIIAADN